MEENKSFRIHRGQGFHVTFPNHVVLSTQFGAGNYGDHYDDAIGRFPKCSNEGGYSIIDNCQADKVEIGIWLDDVKVEVEFFGKKSEQNKWITKEMYKEVFPAEEPDDVMGYVGIDNWLKIFNWCQNYKG